MCITCVWRCTEGFYYLVEISTRAIMQSHNYSLWYRHVTRIGKMSFPTHILYVHHSHKPRFYSYHIMIDTSFHTNKEVGFWTETTYFIGPIFRTLSQFRECERHLRNS